MRDSFGQDTSGVADQTLIKALSHPLRAQALTILNQRVASPKEIAGELSEQVGKVSYHVKELQNLGCVELVDTAQRRGATEHYYRGVDQAHFSSFSLDLDSEGWKEANGLLDETRRRLTEIGEESEGRRTKARIHATFGLLGFESPA